MITYVPSRHQRALSPATLNGLCLLRDTKKPFVLLSRGLVQIFNVISPLDREA